MSEHLPTRSSSNDEAAAAEDGEPAALPPESSSNPGPPRGVLVAARGWGGGSQQNNNGRPARRVVRAGQARQRGGSAVCGRGAHSPSLIDALAPTRSARTHGRCSHRRSLPLAAASLFTPGRVVVAERASARAPAPVCRDRYSRRRHTPARARADLTSITTGCLATADWCCTEPVSALCSLSSHARWLFARFTESPPRRDV